MTASDNKDALLAAAVATIENLLPWASSYAETQRTSLHGDIEFVRIRMARETLAKLKTVTA